MLTVYILAYRRSTCSGTTAVTVLSEYQLIPTMRPKQRDTFIAMVKIYDVEKSPAHAERRENFITLTGYGLLVNVVGYC